jgi:drug/metabolite transporter superfamily protein YnfA
MVGRSGRWLVSGTVTLMCFARACTQPVLPSAVYIYAGYAGIYAAVAILIRMPLVDREVLTIPIMIGASCYLI